MFFPRIILVLFIVTLGTAPSARAQHQENRLQTGMKNLGSGIGFVYKPNRFALELLGDYKQASFENNNQINTPTRTRDNPNEPVIQSTIRASYDTETGWTPYIETTFSRNNFINENLSAPHRDNDLFRLLAGSAFNYKGIVYGFFGIGMDSRSYKDSRIASARGLALESKISWEPRPKSKITFDLSRETFEDNEIIAGLTQTETGLEYSHEVKQNLFLKLIGSYNSEDFNDSPRQDDTITTGLGMQYVISTKFQLGADYNYMTRDSNMNGLDFDDNTLMLRAKVTW